jgi:hypothetical protein
VVIIVFPITSCAFWSGSTAPGFMTGGKHEAAREVFVGHTPQVLMQGRRKSRRRTPTRIPLYFY